MRMSQPVARPKLKRFDQMANQPAASRPPATMPGPEITPPAAPPVPCIRSRKRRPRGAPRNKPRQGAAPNAVHPTLASDQIAFVYAGLMEVRRKSSTVSSTVSTLAHYPAPTRRTHAECPDATANQSAYPCKMNALDMTHRYRKFKRSWGKVAHPPALSRGRRGEREFALLQTPAAKPVS
jgi:hypothetical protein